MSDMSITVFYYAMSLTVLYMNNELDKYEDELYEFNSCL